MAWVAGIIFGVLGLAAFWAGFAAGVWWLRSQPAAPRGRHAARQPEPEPLPELPPVAAAAIDAAHANQLARHRPRSVPLAAEIGAGVAAITGTAARLFTSAAVLALFAYDNRSVERYPDLARSWEHDTGTLELELEGMPAAERARRGWAA